MDVQTIQSQITEEANDENTWELMNSEISLIDNLQPDPTLNLAVKLEAFWKQNWPKIKDTEELLFWVGPKASFTDTRMMYIWLKTWADNSSSSLIESNKAEKDKEDLQLKIWNSPEFNLEFENLNSDLNSPEKKQLLLLLKQAEPEYRSILQYSGKPRIG